MGSRTMPTECEHGKVLDWGDFGSDPDDGSVGAEPCEICLSASPDGESSELSEGRVAAVPTNTTAGLRSGVDRIAAERSRQIEQEGWTAEHDDGHANDLLLAAIAYSYEGIRTGHPMALAIWPWDEEWWKPTDRIRSLVKAGALIAAEIDRLQRVTSQPAVLDELADLAFGPLRPE